MKKVVWLGTSRKDLRSFPAAAQHALGVELLAVQLGAMPEDSKPMPGIGKGVEEIRVWVESGTYRMIYIARLEKAVYVLHAFQKKAQQTPQRDIELARTRFRQLERDL